MRAGRALSELSVNGREDAERLAVRPIGHDRIKHSIRRVCDIRRRTHVLSSGRRNAAVEHQNDDE
jgi:hypothetical protein